MKTGQCWQGVVLLRVLMSHLALILALLQSQVDAATVGFVAPRGDAPDSIPRRWKQHASVGTTTKLVQHERASEPHSILYSWTTKSRPMLLWSSSLDSFTSNTADTNIEQQPKSSLAQSSSRVAILLCPAQFCVPADYQDFLNRLIGYSGQTLTLPLSSASSDQQQQQQQLHKMPPIATCRVAPLPRNEWIKVARQVPTANFWKATLPIVDTLGWYFDAIEKGIAEILVAENETIHGSSSSSTDKPLHLCLIGHSIGGWVARAYLGGLSSSSTAVHRWTLDHCTSLITLGTPHVSPDTALVDQTRGLLAAIEAARSCSAGVLASRGIDITCVCSNALAANLISTNVEQLIATMSYYPLLGRLQDGNATAVTGDGIVPIDLAFLPPPARGVVLQQCQKTASSIRHSHVVPTPWNLWDGYASSIALPAESYPSYVSEGVMEQWIQYIQ